MANLLHELQQAGGITRERSLHEQLTESGGPSRSRKLGFGFASGSNIVGNLMDIVEQTHEYDFDPETGEGVTSIRSEQEQKEIRDRQLAEKQAYLEENYPEFISNPELADDPWVTVGHLGKAVADPTTLLPIGTAANLAKGALSAGKVVKAAGGAAGVSAGIGATDALTRQLASTGEYNAEEIAEVAAISGALGGVAAPILVLGGRGVVSLFRSKARNGQHPTVDEIVEVESNIPRKYLSSYEQMMGSQPTVQPGKSMDEAAKYAESVQEAVPRLAKIEDEVAVNKTFDQLDEAAAAAKQKQIDDAWEAHEAWYAGQNETVSKIKQLHENIAKGDMKKAGATGPVAGDSRARALRNMETTINNRDVHRAATIKRQSGAVSQAALINIAKGGTGGLVGYGFGGPEGAAMGAALSLGTPLAYSKLVRPLMKRTGDVIDKSVEGITSHVPVISSGEGFFRSLGPAGRELDDLMEKAAVQGRTAANQVFAPIHAKLKNLTDIQSEQLVTILRNSKLGSSNPEVQGIANTIRKEFAKVLDEAVDAGVLTKQKAMSLGKNLFKEGYFPRVYNFDFLKSQAGKDAWHNLWSKKTPEQADRLLHSVLGEGTTYKRLAKAIKEGSIDFRSRSFANQVRRIMESERVGKGSGHLESPRRINLSDEELKPFLINHPDAVLSSYFDEVYRRIHMAKNLGADDEIFKEVSARIIKDADAKGLNYADVEKRLTQEYATFKGSDQSDVVKSWHNLKERSETALKIANTAATWKLGLAQIVNATQVAANAPTKLLAMSGGNPITTLQAVMRGTLKAATKEGQEMAAASGAAAEATLYQLMNEGMAHAGEKGLTQWAKNPVKELLATFTDPHKFLQRTGFTSIEKTNRAVAANIGRSYIETVVAQRARALGKGKSVAKYDKQLKELLIDPSDISPNGDISELALLTGMHKFSNDINFTNASKKIPLAWQSPAGKVFTKFKTFAFNQGRFIKENVIDQALKHGNYTPLAYYLTAAGTTGMGAAELRAWIKGDDKDLSNTERYLRGLFTGGGLGLIGDMSGLAAAAVVGKKPSPQDFAAQVAGPIVQDAGRVVTTAGKLISGDVKGATNTAAGILPPGIRDLVKSAIEEKKASSRGRRVRKSRNSRSR